MRRVARLGRSDSGGVARPDALQGDQVRQRASAPAKRSPVPRRQLFGRRDGRRSSTAPSPSSPHASRPAAERRHAKGVGRRGPRGYPDRDSARARKTAPSGPSVSPHGGSACGMKKPVTTADRWRGSLRDAPAGGREIVGAGGDQVRAGSVRRPRLPTSSWIRSRIASSMRSLIAGPPGAGRRSGRARPAAPRPSA